MDSKKIVFPGKGNTVIDENGAVLTPPDHWSFQPAGDAGITRKITAKGMFWRVQVKKGRRMISKGVWAPSETIQQAVKEMTATRATDSYKKNLESSRKRREKKQEAYSLEFLQAVKAFLNFAPCYTEFENKLATAVSEHAVPVGSGTVARTEMIPIEDRAARAVIAWMRHQTTAYDTMKIPRIKGKRREVRRMLAERSSKLLAAYRKGDVIMDNCPLKKAINTTVV